VKEILVKDGRRHMRPLELDCAAEAVAAHSNSNKSQQNQYDARGDKKSCQRSLSDRWIRRAQNLFGM
jgi:hypothetical protein